MSLAGAYQRLADLIAEDETVAAQFSDNLTVIHGNREITRINANELPALLMELGASELATEVSGHVTQGEHELRAALVWHEQNNYAAFKTRLALTEAVPRAVLGDPSLGGHVAGAEVSRITPDMGMHHPRHAIQFVVAADIEISRG